MQINFLMNTRIRPILNFVGRNLDIHSKLYDFLTALKNIDI